MPSDELHRLLAELDDDTRACWEAFLHEVDAEVHEKGPTVAGRHLEEAVKHLLAAGWAVRRCYDPDDAGQVMEPVGDAADCVQSAKSILERLKKKPEWSQ